MTHWPCVIYLTSLKEYGESHPIWWICVYHDQQWLPSSDQPLLNQRKVKFVWAGGKEGEDRRNNRDRHQLEESRKRKMDSWILEYLPGPNWPSNWEISDCSKVEVGTDWYSWVLELPAFLVQSNYSLLGMTEGLDLAYCVLMEFIWICYYFFKKHFSMSSYSSLKITTPFNTNTTPLPTNRYFWRKQSS